MNRNEQERAQKALEREKKRYKYQNEWTAAHYERQTVTMPKGTRERIKALTGQSVNGYINALVADDLERLEDLQNNPLE